MQPPRRTARALDASGAFMKALQHRFQATCEQVGVDRTLHDLRRTAAREFRRNGVSEGEIMKLSGWKTRSMFDRYYVIDEDDLAQAVAKRFAPIVNKPAIPAPSATDAAR